MSPALFESISIKKLSARVDSTGDKRYLVLCQSTDVHRCHVLKTLLFGYSGLGSPVDLWIWLSASELGP